MDVKETYYSLVTRNLTINDIDLVIGLKSECKAENNYEYFYLTNLLIIDIYINANLYTDALNIAYKNFDDLDKSLYTNIYVSLLERLIYICIQKKNFLSACRYANEKRLYLDINDKNAVNRWYLEMAYIHDALNEKTKALSDLNAILENDPSSDLRLIVLNNITKLYIDNKNIEYSKKYLNDSIELAYKLNDMDSQTYCQYLNAKLYVLEGKNHYACKLYYDIFRGQNLLNDEYLGYLNEFLTLLNEMKEYGDAKKLANKYIDSANKTEDLYLKKDFYKNYLQAIIFLVPSLSDEIKRNYLYIDKIEDEIRKTNELITLESSEDDKISQINSKLKETIDRLEKITNIVNYALIAKNERECLYDFSKNLEKEVNFNNAVFVVFNRATFNAYPKFLDSYSKVSTFEYKKERMYEREINYTDLNNTIIEMVVKGNKDISIDFSETKVPVCDIITGKSYLDLKVKYLYATPFIYDNDLYACAVYTSNNVDITKQESVVTLKIANSLLESKLVNLYYQESLRTQKDILEVAMDGLQEGLYYYDVKRKKIFLSEQMKKFLGVTRDEVSEADYCQIIKQEDIKGFLSRDDEISAGKKYMLEYSITINDEEILLQDKGSPYFSKNGTVSFYICTINRILSNETVLKKEKMKYLSVLERKDLDEYLLKKVDDSFALLVIKLDEYDNNLFEILYHYCLGISNDLYYLNSNIYALVIDSSDERAIDHYANDIISKISNCKVSVVMYPKMFNNISQLIELALLSLNSKLRYQKLDDAILSKYNQSKYISNCIKKAINDNEVELLFGPLYCMEKLKGYYVDYNIKGITNSNNIKTSLEKNDRVEFDTFDIEKLLELNKYFYVDISLHTILWMKKNDYINERNMLKFRKIAFCITKFSSQLDNIIDYLTKFEMKVFVSLSIATDISFKTLVSDAIKGVLALDDYDLNSEFIKFILDHNKLIISDNYENDNRYIFFDGKMYNDIKNINEKD